MAFPQHNPLKEKKSAIRLWVRAKLSPHSGCQRNVEVKRVDIGCRWGVSGRGPEKRKVVVHNRSIVDEEGD